MQPQPNLDLNPTPTSASGSYFSMRAAPRHAAVGFVFSLTIASSVHPDIDLYRKLTLPPINCVGAGSTCTASVIREAAVQDMVLDPLEALLNEVHAQISEETWSKMPTNFADEVDRIVYGA